MNKPKTEGKRKKERKEKESRSRKYFLTMIRQNKVIKGI